MGEKVNLAEYVQTWSIATSLSYYKVYCQLALLTDFLYNWHQIAYLISCVLDFNAQWQMSTVILVWRSILFLSTHILKFWYFFFQAQYRTRDNVFLTSGLTVLFSNSFCIIISELVQNGLSELLLVGCPVLRERRALHCVSGWDRLISGAPRAHCKCPCPHVLHYHSLTIRSGQKLSYFLKSFPTNNLIQAAKTPKNELFICYPERNISKKEIPGSVQRGQKTPEIRLGAVNRLID